MASMTPSIFCARTDKIAAAYLAILGSSASGFGSGNGDPTLANDWGGSRKLREFQNSILANQDVDELTALLTPSSAAIQQAPVQRQVIGILYPLLTAFAVRCNISGISRDIPSFATYYNTGVGGPWNALLAPEFATLYGLCGFVTASLGATNVYSPAIASMGSKVAGGAFTAGTGVDTTKYAGAAISKVTISGATFTASSTITVIGNAVALDGSAQTGRTFTATGVNANGTFTLVPAITGDLLTAVTSIVFDSNITAGTATIGAFIPAGRVSPPT